MANGRVSLGICLQENPGASQLEILLLLIIMINDITYFLGNGYKKILLSAHVLLNLSTAKACNHNIYLSY